MTAGILENDSMIYRYGSAKPWHSLGHEAKPESEFDINSFYEDSGLNWEVTKIPLITLPRAQAAVNVSVRKNSCIELEPDVDHYAVIRQDTNDILGVVGKNYTTINNKNSLEWFRDWVETRTLGFETAGSLFNGRKIFILAHFVNNPFSEITPDDHVKKYILLSNSHDGTNSLRVGISLVRCVCWNTLSLAHRAADSKLIRLRHSSKIEENLNNIKEVISVAEQDFKASIDQYRKLLVKDVNQNDVKRFIRIVVQGEKDADKPWNELPTRTKNLINQIISNMDSPMNPGKPSMWKLYNAMNQYLNHNIGRTVDSRINNLWWGTSKDMDKKAFELALEMAA